MKVDIEVIVLDSMLEKFLTNFGKFCGLNVMASGNDLKLTLPNIKYAGWYKVRLSIEVDEKPIDRDC